MAKLTLTQKYPNISIDTSQNATTVVLNVLDTIRTGALLPSDLLSPDLNNDLSLDNNGKLFLNTDELTTTFDYAATIYAVWSI